jgi:SAM-dependent methyltransferase
MKRNEHHNDDPFGMALWHTHQGIHADVICELENGAIFSDRSAPYFSRTMHPPVRHALAYMHGKVLDLGTGAGRFALHAQERGYHVVAVDSSWLATEVAEDRGVKVVVWEDMWEHVSGYNTSPPPYDTVLMLGNNLGLLGTLSVGRKRLRALHRITSERAFVIGDCRHPASVWDELSGTKSQVFPQVLQKVRYRYGLACTPYFQFASYSPEEVELLTKGTGWEVLRAYKDRVGHQCFVLQKE